MINQLVLIVCSCVSVCEHWRVYVCVCELCLYVGVPDNASLTLWLGDKSQLVRPSWFDGRWEGWLTPRPFCVGRRCSVSGAPVSGLMSDGCSGHAGPWLSDRAGWPPSALTLTPLYGHQLTAPPPPPSPLPPPTPPTQHPWSFLPLPVRLKSGLKLRFVQLLHNFVMLHPTRAHTQKPHDAKCRRCASSQLKS